MRGNAYSGFHVIRVSRDATKSFIPTVSSMFFYKKTARPAIPAAMAPMTGRPDGAAPPVLCGPAEPVAEGFVIVASSELMLASMDWSLLESELAAAPVAVASSEVIEARIDDASPRIELANDWISPGTPLISAAMDDAADLIPSGTPVISPATLERKLSICALATAPRVAMAMSEKRMLMGMLM